MKTIMTTLEGIVIIEHDVFLDERGWFMETYSKPKMRDLGIDVEFVQDNHSYSERAGTIRGLHYQKAPMAQSKLVRCSSGSIWDVAVDIRRGSPTYGKWFGAELSEKNRRSMFITRGHAHGYITLEDNSEVHYKVDNVYDQRMERTIRFDDPVIGIDWGIEEPILSEKDRKAGFLEAQDNDFSYP
jgi:dTDP-4-dehydrorhamnose 3,5-epimerase